MQTLSKDAEALILDSIRDVVARVAQGDEPTAAVVKVAQARQLPSGYVPLVVQAYNVGRQTQQREGSDDVLGKIASFALADTQVALKELYPDDVQTPTEKKAATAVDPAYSKPAVKPLEKAASGGLWDIQAPAAYPRDPDSDSRHYLAERQRATRALDTARMKVAHAKDQFAAKVAAITGYFRRSAMDRIGWADFTKNAETLFPQEAPKLLNFVDSQINIRKRARWEIHDRFPTNALFDNKAEPYGLLEGCVKAAEAVLRANQELSALSSKKAEAKTATKPVEYNVLGLPVREAPSKEGSFLEFAVGSGVGKGLSDWLSGTGAKPTKDLVNDKVLDLEDPSHDAELRKVQTQAMITDFLANDPVISGFDPDEVTNAYNEIAQVTPRASTAPALMRPLLRKRLSAGGIEPFEASEMAKLEHTLGQGRPMNGQQQQQGVLDGNSILG